MDEFFLTGERSRSLRPLVQGTRVRRETRAPRQVGHHRFLLPQKEKPLKYSRVGIMRSGTACRPRLTSRRTHYAGAKSLCPSFTTSAIRACRGCSPNPFWSWGGRDPLQLHRLPAACAAFQPEPDRHWLHLHRLPCRGQACSGLRADGFGRGRGGPGSPAS
jgi:hypothetical protein